MLYDDYRDGPTFELIGPREEFPDAVAALIRKHPDWSDARVADAWNEFAREHGMNPVTADYARNLR